MLPVGYAILMVLACSFTDEQCLGYRYLYQTLQNSLYTVPTIAQADMIYVYDYCYKMWGLADHHAQDNWWLKENYDLQRRAGQLLLSLYRHAAVP